jgi:uncharacterized protein
MSSLRLNLRGADGSGEDIYHIGMVEDLEAAVRSPDIASYPEVVALGYSLGGHVALRFAALAGARGGIRAMAAVCAPLDLPAGVAHIDHPLRWPYRRHLLDGVKEVYRQVVARRAMPLSLAEMLAIRGLREWDDKVVAPRFGFHGADDYYRRVAVGPLLAGLEVPVLFIAGVGDPMIPAWTLRPLLARASSMVETRWIRRGGHLGFPGEFEILGSVVKWLASI